MDNLTFLADWSMRFLKNKDHIRKEITSLDKGNGIFDFIINYRGKVKHFLIKTSLENGLLDNLRKDLHIGIFTLSNRENTTFIIKNWEKFIQHKLLTLYFINPFSDSDKVWTISPYVHDRICDRSSLETGIRAVAGMVDSIYEDELKAKVKAAKEESGQ